MNTRQLLHTVQAVAIAVGAGSLIIPGLPQDVVVSVAGLVAFVLNAYMGFSTTGESKPAIVKPAAE